MPLAETSEANETGTEVVPASSEPGARTFVALLFLGSVGAACGLVALYGTATPKWDDLTVLPHIVGASPVTFDWLWQLHNEHRIPLPKLIMVGIHRLSGFDYRDGMVLNLVLLTAAAAAILLLVRRLRGGWEYNDGFLVLVLLGLGHYENLLWSFQIAFILSTALAVLLLVLIAQSADDPSTSRVCSCGLAAFLMAMCGPPGIVMLPPICVWLAILGWRRPSDDASGRWLRWALAAALATLPALYLIGFRTPTHHDTSGTSLWSAPRFAFVFLGCGFGPSSPILRPGNWIGALLFTVATGYLLIRVLWSRPAERVRALGIACYLSGVLALAIVMGRSRPGDWMLSRYAILSVPAWLGGYIAWQLYGPIALRKWIQMCLFVTACLFTLPNAKLAQDESRAYAEEVAAMVRDVRAGATPAQVMQKHTHSLSFVQTTLPDSLALLRSAGIPPFPALRDDPIWREQPIQLEPSSIHEASWKQGVLRIQGPESRVCFTLAEPTRVEGVRIRYRHQSDSGYAPKFKLTWRNRRHPDPASEGVYQPHKLPTGQEFTTTIWIGTTLDELCFQPDTKPGTFEFFELVCLLPPNKSEGLDIDRSDPAQRPEELHR